MVQRSEWSWTDWAQSCAVEAELPLPLPSVQSYDLQEQGLHYPSSSSWNQAGSHFPVQLHQRKSWVLTEETVQLQPNALTSALERMLTNFWPQGRFVQAAELALNWRAGEGAFTVVFWRFFLSVCFFFFVSWVSWTEVTGIPVTVEEGRGKIVWVGNVELAHLLSVGLDWFNIKLCPYVRA